MVGISRPDLRVEAPAYRRGWRDAISWAKSSGYWRRLPRGATARYGLRCRLCRRTVPLRDRRDFARAREAHVRAEHADALIPGLERELELVVGGRAIPGGA